MTDTTRDRVVPPAAPLDAAREHLRRLVNAADAAGDPDERWLAPLYAVSDMVCRIGDHADSTHYQASKVADLVRGALLLRAALFVRHHIADGDSEIWDVTELLIDVEAAVATVLWGLGDGSVERTDARRLSAAVDRLSKWAVAVAASAVPDRPE